MFLWKKKKTGYETDDLTKVLNPILLGDVENKVFHLGFLQ